MARVENRGVLFAGTSGANPKRPRSAGRQSHRQLAGRAIGVGTTAQLGSVAGWFGARPTPFIFGRWRSLDLEPSTRPLGQCPRAIGFLSCQPALLECLARRTRRARPAIAALDGPSTALVATWPTKAGLA